MFLALALCQESLSEDYGKGNNATRKKRVWGLEAIKFNLFIIIIIIIIS